MSFDIGKKMRSPPVGRPLWYCIQPKLSSKLKCTQHGESIPKTHPDVDTYMYFVTVFSSSLLILPNRQDHFQFGNFISFFFTNIILSSCIQLYEHFLIIIFVFLLFVFIRKSISQNVMPWHWTLKNRKQLKWIRGNFHTTINIIRVLYEKKRKRMNGAKNVDRKIK